MKPYNVLMDTRGVSHEAWEECRRQGIGGSDADEIVGLSPWGSALDVYADKIGVAPEKELTDAMRMGIELEPYVANCFAKATGKKVRRLNAILQSKEYPFMLANVDRMIVGEKAGLECKTTSPWNKHDWKNGEVPDTYYVQCTHYMAVTGMPKWYLAVYVYGDGFYWYEVERNEEDIAALIAAEGAFWECVQTKTPPDPDGSKAASNIIRSLYKGDEGGEIQLTGVATDLARLQEIKELKKSLETEESAIEQRIQLQMADAHIGHTQGWRVEWKPYSRTQIDSKRLRAEHPEIADEYSKTSSYRRFTVKKDGASA